MSGINIQPGHIARHTPRSAGAQGREAAVVDVAQDLLLQYLHSKGILDLVAIKRHRHQKALRRQGGAILARS